MKVDSLENKYTNKPNLLRVAAELAGGKNQGKVLEAIRLVLESSVDNSADGNQNFGLLGR